MNKLITLEYRAREMSPAKLLPLVLSCGTTCPWWYVLECRVSSFPIPDDDDTAEACFIEWEILDKHIERSPGLTVSQRDLTVLLNPYVEYEDLLLVGCERPSRITSAEDIPRIGSLTIEYRDTAWCLFRSFDSETLEAISGLYGPYRRVSSEDWPRLGPW
jgi:hypothetical protein